VENTNVLDLVAGGVALAILIGGLVMLFVGKLVRSLIV